MSKNNGKPCKKCGGNNWGKKQCLNCSRLYNAEYYQKNKERRKKESREYYRANNDKTTKYYQDNKQRFADNQKRTQLIRRRRKPEKHRSYSAKRRTQKTEAGGSFTAAEWVDLCRQYGWKCLACGRSNRKLTVDHIIPISRGGGSNISNIQPLCKPCNSSKGNYHTTDYRKMSKASKIIKQLKFW